MTPSPVEPTPIQLNWTDPETGEQHHSFETPPITLGRAPDNTILLNGDKVSRHHAAIEARQDAVTLVDRNSRNGTYLNGRRRRYPTPLPNGDVIRIAQYRFKVTFDDETQTRTTVFETQNALRSTAYEVESIQSTPENVENAAAQGRSGSHSSDFPPACFAQPYVSMEDAARANLPVDQTTYLTIGGGLGSFTWVDYLLICGVDPGQVTAIGFEPKPYSRYQRLCRRSQIPAHERLRSNSDSRPDNIWGWPGYAVQEAWQSLLKGDLKNAAYVTWQIFGEPTLAETYTPRLGDVIASIDREAKRIGWARIWRYGSVRAIRKTNDGRYIVAYSQTNEQHGQQHRLLVARYVHLAVGYPALKFLPDLRAYREQSGDFKQVVNAYENHEHVYEHLRRRGGTVLVRGRGIVASRVIQRIDEIRRESGRKDIGLLHLMRRPTPEGFKFRQAQRSVENHWEFQPFNWPKACWGGDLQRLLEKSGPVERDELLTGWGGTTTANRQDWRRIVSAGQREGWYQIRFGQVESVARRSDKIATIICGHSAIQDETQLLADFIIDATGLISNLAHHPLSKDLVEHYHLPLNPQKRLTVSEDFEVTGMENGQGRLYGAGAMTLGGPYAPVDSFLGLQFSAQRSVDALARCGAPGLRYLNSFRSVSQWFRWVGGMHP